jgi:putative endonuclease
VSRTAAQPERAQRGARAEQLAAEHVAAMGMDILGRNVRVGHLEVDILARDGPVLVVVEVRCRSRRSWGRPFGSIDRLKQRRLARAASLLWTRGFAQRRGMTRVRFDVASVTLSDGAATLEYLRAAFVAPSE